MKNIKRGEIYFANLNPTIGKEINNPYDVLIGKEESGLIRNSKIKCNQIRTIGKARLTKKAGAISKDKLNQIERAVCIHLDINIL